MRKISLALALTTGVLFTLGLSRPALCYLPPGIPFLINQHIHWLMIVLALGSVITACLGRKTERTPQTPSTETMSDAGLALRVGIITVILGQIIIGWNEPLDRDEKQMGALISEATLSSVLNPMESTKRFIPNIHQSVSIVSLYLTSKVFGVSEASLRASAFPFAVAFLYLLLVVTVSESVPLFVSLLTLSHLLSNRLLSWYLIAAKGYASLLFFALLTAILLEKVLSAKLRPRLGSLILLGTSALFTGLSHSFGSLYLLGLATYLLSRYREPAGRQALVTISAVAPLLMVFAFNHLVFLDGFGDFFAAQLPGALPVITTLLGLTHGLFTRALIAFVGILFLLSLSGRLDKRIYRPLITLLTAVVVAGSLAYFLRVRVMHARYFIAFLVPALFFVGYLVESVPPGRVRAVSRVLALALLVVLPWAEYPAMSHMLTANHRPFHDFIHEARSVVMSTSGACTRVVGDVRQSDWARVVFLPKNPEQCSSNYLLSFEVDAFNHPIAPVETPRGAELVLGQQGRRALYLMTSEDETPRLGRKDLEAPPTNRHLSSPDEIREHQEG